MQLVDVEKYSLEQGKYLEIGTVIKLTNGLSAVVLEKTQGKILVEDSREVWIELNSELFYEVIFTAIGAGRMARGQRKTN